MSNYTGFPCPVCEQAFLGGDDIVVCPDCGAPYHRACYHQAGRCLLDDLHRAGALWQAPAFAHPEPPHPEGAQHAPSGTCPRCAYQNPGDAILCQYCGWRLGAAYTAQEPRPVYDGTAQQGFPSAKQPPPRSFNSFFQQNISFGDEIVPGVTYKEISDFVGPNSIQFLTKFKALLQGAFFSLNWPALFFSVYYCFYRKAYKFGAILSAVLLCALVPYLVSTSLYYAELVRAYGIDAFMSMLLDLSFYSSPPQVAGLQTFIFFGNVNSVVYMAVRMAAGLMFNKLYLGESCKKILKIKKDGHYSTGSMEYSYALARSGGTALASVVALGVLYFAANVFTVFIVMLPSL